MSPSTPEEAPREVRAETREAAQPVLGQPVRRRVGSVVAAVIGFVVAGLALIALAVYFVAVLGPGVTLIGALLALIPLGIVLFGVRWVDRWEPEPRGALVFAFLWGATVSVLLALFIDTGVQQVIAAMGGPTPETDFLQAVIQAPLVEEFGKGLGVLLIFLFARHLLGGPVDGIVYAAMVAAGFAFTENIQYFGLELAGHYGAQSDVGYVLFVRGILSPFAHVLFTAFTGLLIGLAARSGNRLLAVGAFFVGLLPAILLHAFWNGSSYLVNFYVVYLFVQVPFFAIAVGFVAGLRRKEVSLTRARLEEYAAAGWFNPAEVPVLATPSGRRGALAWARSHGLGAVMKRYIRDATQLAFARQRIISGRDLARDQADEAALLIRVAASRHALAESRPARPVAPEPPGTATPRP